MEVFMGVLNDNDDDSPAKCRERRQRRIKMRQRTVVGQTEMKQGESREQVKIGGVGPAKEVEAAAPAVTDRLTENADVAPVFGIISVQGRSREMEDAVCVQTEVCRPDFNLGRSVHFFAVFDGHGGAHVAKLCRAKMHMLVEEELMSEKVGKEAGGGCDEEGQWRRAIKRSFERVDEEAVKACACKSSGHDCGCNPLDLAFAGSTAVVALLTDRRILVANCGDSRAVLGRSGTAVPLTVDHKPDRPDELKRIEAAGGQVIFFEGARVEGVLAMSRAIVVAGDAEAEKRLFDGRTTAMNPVALRLCEVNRGDKYLKPLVIPDPEITFFERKPEDDCLILASDGLWDVISGDLACKVAHECLMGSSDELNGTPHEVEIGDQSDPSRCTMAATLLTRLAMGRSSSGNISVIVVDLKKR